MTELASAAERKLRLALERAQMGSIDALIYEYFEAVRSAVTCPHLSAAERRKLCRHVLMTIEWVRGMLLIQRGICRERFIELRRADRFIGSSPAGPQTLQIEL